MAASGQTVDAAFRIIRLDDQLRWVSSVGEIFLGEDGTPSWAAGILIDVTDLREAQLELAAREERYRVLATANSIGEWRAKPDGEFIECSFWCEFTGQSKEGAQWLGWLHAIHPDDVEAVSANWTDALRIGSSTQFSYRVRHHSGEYRWILTKVVPIRDADGNIREWIGSNEDIHIRRKAEETLRVNEERLRLALQIGRMVTWDYDYKAGHITSSENSLDILGLKSASIDEYRSRIHPDDRRRVSDALLAAQETGKPLLVQYRFFGPEGDIRWLHTRAQVLRNVCGNATRIIGVTFDVTSQREAEARHDEAKSAHEQTRRELRDLDVKCDALRKIAGDMVWSVSPEGKAADMSEWCRFSGQTLDQAQDWGWMKAIHPADRERTRDGMQCAIDERSSRTFDCRVRDEGGAYHWFEIRIAPVLGDDGSIREWIGSCQRIRGAIAETDGSAPHPSRDMHQCHSQTSLLPWQIRAARAIVGWSARELAEASGVSLSTVRRIEEAQCHDARMLAAVRSALELGGVEFPVSPDGSGSVRPALNPLFIHKTMDCHNRHEVENYRPS